MKHAERVRQKIKYGDESEVQGLLEQWLREGKVDETEALLSATDMFTAGVDSVCEIIQYYYTYTTDTYCRQLSL